MSEQQVDYQVEQTFYETMPEGLYPGKVQKIDGVEGLYGPQFKFVFEVYEEGKILPQEITAWCSRKFSTKSKLFAWTKAALGGNPIPEDYNFSALDIIGKDLTIFVEQTEPNEDGTVYNRIGKVMALQGKPGVAGVITPRPLADALGGL